MLRTAGGGVLSLFSSVTPGVMEPLLAAYGGWLLVGRISATPDADDPVAVHQWRVGGARARDAIEQTTRCCCFRSCRRRQ